MTVNLPPSPAICLQKTHSPRFGEKGHYAGSHLHPGTQISQSYNHEFGKRKQSKKPAGHSSMTSSFPSSSPDLEPGKESDRWEFCSWLPHPNLPLGNVAPTWNQKQVEIFKG
jgi:hypothetical protein